MIVFGGGLGGSNSNEVWVLENANGTGGTPTWTQLSPSGTPPAGREEHSAVYDPSHNLMTVFGGNNSTSVLRDTWVLSNANGLGGTPTWKQLGPFSLFAEVRNCPHRGVQPEDEQDDRLWRCAHQCARYQRCLGFESRERAIDWLSEI